MIMTAGVTDSPDGDDAMSPGLPAGMLKAVRMGNTRSKILIELLFAIHIHLSDQAPVVCPKKLQVRDDAGHMQR